MLDVDPVWIGHVLHNLVANAVEHGHGTAGVTMIRARQLDGFVVVSVCDDGRGFQTDERHLVFDPLFQGRRAREESAGGIGLGLYLCRELVEAHGGRIWVDETERGGSVSFTLPCRRAEPVEAEDTPHGFRTVLATGT